MGNDMDIDALYKAAPYSGDVVDTGKLMYETDAPVEGDLTTAAGSYGKLDQKSSTQVIP